MRDFILSEVIKTNQGLIQMRKTLFGIGVLTAFSSTILGLVPTPAYADGVFSTSNLRIGNVNLSINNSSGLLTKTEASTAKWLGEQKFAKFLSMMWVPEHNVLFISGVLPGSSVPVLVKIKGTGGGGRNMFAINSDGSSMSGYNYRLGSQLLNPVTQMSYNGNLRIQTSRSGEVYWIRGVGGTGNNMFALVNNQECRSVERYNYLLKCGD
jgi:hypothetical protein